MDITKCKIADFNMAFETDIKNLSKIFREYVSDFSKEDVKICITDNDIELEKKLAEDGFDTKYATTYKLSAIHRKIGDWLPSQKAFVLHSACFDVDGVGVAFAAHSGTGKSTHMMLWQKLLGDRMTVVNGDKPIVRFFDNESDKAYAYGSPWMGKEKLGSNMKTQLKHICFIERAKENSCEPIPTEEAIAKIFKQVYMPTDPIATSKTAEHINRLLNSCKLWRIRCNMELDAAEVAYGTIFRQEGEK
ncbi:MAG: hypothetical protein IKT38_05055 [Clostridia bacterium]|nr:hypothetical protein [Clostridia bacterium]